MTTPDYEAALARWASTEHDKQMSELEQSGATPWKLSKYQQQCLAELVDSVRRDPLTPRCNPFHVPLV